MTLAGAGLGSLSIPKTTSAVSATMIEATVRAARQFVLGEPERSEPSAWLLPIS